MVCDLHLPFTIHLSHSCIGKPSRNAIHECDTFKPFMDLSIHRSVRRGWGGLREGILNTFLCPFGCLGPF